jgi:hypothetical protein
MQRAQQLSPMKLILLIISVKQTHIREILYTDLGKLNVKLSFAHYSHELITSEFVITDIYCI